MHDQHHQQQGSIRGGSGTMHTTGTPKRVEGGRLALRIRNASEFDVAFLKCLKENNGISSNEANVTLQTTRIQQGGSTATTATTTTTAGKANNKPLLKPAQLITEMYKNLLTATISIKAINSIAPITSKGVQYLFSNDVEKRIYVKPYPDPRRVEDTTWFTEGDWRRSLFFYSQVIDDSCSPMWMPWSSRAFVFQMGHPSTAIYIGVADYDLGPLKHECIGRVAIDMEKFFPGTLYTLTYTLYKSSNLVDRGMSGSDKEDIGTITVRLCVEFPNKRKHLLKGWKAPGHKWVNSQQ